MELESPQCASPKETVNGKLTKKDLGLHKLIFECGKYKNVEVTYRVNEEISLKGHIEDSGIYCDHCNNVVSASKFEAHAGCAQRRKPYHNTYTSEGKSLHEITLKLSAERNRESDTLCQMCKRSGILVQCDRCPRAYHKECARLSSIPQFWLCPLCGKLFKKENPLGSRVRMVKTKFSKLSSCVLCRCKDFLKTGFGPRTVILCDHCDKEYHISCLKDNNRCDLKVLPSGKWFCSDDCKRTNTALKEFRHTGPKQLPAPALDLIKKKSEGRGLRMNVKTVLRWKLVHGTTHNPTLSSAVNIFHECFQPIIDDSTGKDLITTMIYREKLGGHDFHEMHCAMLTVNSFVVSAALLRVLDHEIAEMPLVATNQPDQGMGYFQSLFYCIQKFLSELGVKHLMVPAVKEVESYWIKKYGFKKLAREKVKKLTRDLYPVLFDGTSILHKALPASQALPEGNGRN